MNIKNIQYKLKPYFANIILIWFGFFLYKTISYYKNFITEKALTTIFLLSLAYTIIGFSYYLAIPKEKIKESKGLRIFRFIKKIIKLTKPNFKEKTAVLFALVKFFFLPIMLNFSFQNFYFLKNQISQITSISTLFSISSFNLILFPLAIGFLFFIDTTIFAFGYAFEAGFLKNKIRSVEPTFLGWAVAIACYPPFNGFLTNHLHWYANDYAFFYNNPLTFILRLIIIILISIYVSATIALFTKSSNLTNRGIVSKGPYAIIRHPAYISKNIAWWLTLIPVISIYAIISMSVWTIIYHLRTITEENHLGKDPDYQEYIKKVKYRYIPGVY